MTPVTRSVWTRPRSGGVDAGMDASSAALTARLTELHEQYVWEVNDAVGRDEPVEQLCDDYADAALRAITAGGPPAHVGGR